jgi:hypothetical protein
MSSLQTLDTQYQTEIAQAIREMESPADRRASKRERFSLVQSIAPYFSGEVPAASAFHPVRCHDLSTAGIAFLLPQRPTFEQVVVALGTRANTIYVMARVLRCTPSPEGFLVGCSFVKKVEIAT